MAASGEAEASGVNPEKKSGVGDPKAVPGSPIRWTQPGSGICPATALAPKRNSLLFLWIRQCRGEGGQGAWATPCPPYPPAQAWTQPLPSLKCVHQPYWRGHSNFASGVDTTRGVTVTGDKPLLDWRRAWRQGLLPPVGGILGSHWTATARLKLGSPQPIRCCPATAASSIGCMGDRRNLNGRL